jgi:hypothetical protein
MKNRIARTGIALFLLFIFANSIFAASATRIHFAHGATSATVWGTLYGQHSQKHYVLRVLAGQHMKVHVTSSQLTNPQIDVTFPNGEHMDRDMQGTQFDTDSTQAGDYRIDVYEGMKGDPGHGKFKLWVEVV